LPGDEHAKFKAILRSALRGQFPDAFVVNLAPNAGIGDIAKR